MRDEVPALRIGQKPTAESSHTMGLPDNENTVTQEWVSAQVKSEAQRQDPGLAAVLRPLRSPGGATGPPGSALKVWFGVKCACETAAVLSVEVERSKTREEVIAAMPQIVDRLRVQYRGFRSMSCSTHQRMRSNLTGRIRSSGE